jgi:hypothetical protein
MLSLFRKSAPSPINPALNDAIIELVYAGNALAQAHIHAPHGVRFCTLCGAAVDLTPDQSTHDDNCPIERHINAVESVRKAVSNG